MSKPPFLVQRLAGLASWGGLSRAAHSGRATVEPLRAQGNAAMRSSGPAEVAHIAPSNTPPTPLQHPRHLARGRRARLLPPRQAAANARDAAPYRSTTAARPQHARHTAAGLMYHVLRRVLCWSHFLRHGGWSWWWRSVMLPSYYRTLQSSVYGSPRIENSGGAQGQGAESTPGRTSPHAKLTNMWA